MNKWFEAPLRTFLAGLLAALPIAITLAVVLWAGKLVDNLAGPSSVIGYVLSLVGMPLGLPRPVDYLLGLTLTLAAIYALGVWMKTGVRKQALELVSSFVRRIPVLGNIYDLSDRFVGLLDKKEEADLKTMSPVWCHFGGEGGTVVLALLPASAPVFLENKAYHAIIVPTAPLPLGGGLLFVPVEWIKPAGFGVEGLTSIYVSMGVALPKFMPMEPSSEALVTNESPHQMT